MSGLPLGPGDLGGLYGDPTAPKLVTGQVMAPAPASATGSLYVRILSFSAQKWGPCPFAPRVQVSGGSVQMILPAVGDPCLVALDEDGQPWVVLWWPG